MDFSSFQRALVPAALVSGVIFSATTFPLFTMRSEPIVIQFQEEPIISGTLDEMAAPYLGLATVLSLGAGIATMGLIGWRHSSRKSSQTGDQLSELQQSLLEKEAQIEELKFSEARLEAAGLSFFLHDKESKRNVVPSTPQEAANYTVIEDVVTEASIAELALEAQTISSTEETVADREIFIPRQVMASVKAAAPTATPAPNAAVTALPAAQTFMSYSRPSSLSSASNPVTADEPSVASAQINELMAHLKQVMTEIEKLKTNTAVSQNA